MRVGVVILPDSNWPSAAQTWRLADEWGFAHAWTYDHLAWRDLLDDRWFAAIPTLAAAAAVTQRIALGTLVASPNFRHPVPLVKEALTVHDVSGGRFILGIGAGAGGADATVLGNAEQSPAIRASRFAEFADLTDRLLRNPHVDFDGEHYRVRHARTDPSLGPNRAMPLAVAATGPSGIRAAVRHADVWVTNGFSPQPGRIAPTATPELIAVQIARLHATCEELGRDPTTLRTLLVYVNRTEPALASPEAFFDVAGRYSAAGISDLVVPFPRIRPPYIGDRTVLEKIAGQLVQGAV